MYQCLKAEFIEEALGLDADSDQNTQARQKVDQLWASHGQEVGLVFNWHDRLTKAVDRI